MLALDTSAIVDFLGAASTQAAKQVELALSQRMAVLPPVVLTELLSDSNLKGELRRIILEIPMLEIGEGYWARAGELRAKVLKQGRKARLADTLIAQVCIDHSAVLVTCDKDFKAFSSAAGFKVVGI